MAMLVSRGACQRLLSLKASRASFHSRWKMSRMSTHRSPNLYCRNSPMARLGLPSSKWSNKRGRLWRGRSLCAGRGWKTAKPALRDCTRPLSTARRTEKEVNRWRATARFSVFTDLALALALGLLEGPRKKVRCCSAHSSVSTALKVSPASQRSRRRSGQT
eukprot:11179862-Lingulodinium_polyedra.AAC.1